MVEEGKRKETDEKRKGKMERQARGGRKVGEMEERGRDEEREGKMES